MQITKKIFALKENESREIGNPKKILVVRQHNQFGDLLCGVSIFRAIKETFPDSDLSVILSPQNYYAVTKNKFIDKQFIFNKKKLINPFYFFKLIKFLRSEYDLSIVPVTVSISFTSNFLSRISNSKIRIGAKSLDGKSNKSAFLFDRLVEMDWRKYPDSHVSDFGLEIIRPFGINTTELKSHINFEEEDLNLSTGFAEAINKEAKQLLIGLHVGAGKPPNRWVLDNYLQVIEKLNQKYSAKFYFTGSSSDYGELNYIKERLKIDAGWFINKTIPELTALISISDLFITNDTGVMHVAGVTRTKQISIFGATNPFNWAPLGKEKYFLRNHSQLINDVTVEEVFSLAVKLLENKID